MTILAHHDTSVFVTYHHLLLADDNEPIDWQLTTPGNGLAQAQTVGAIIITGVHTGAVRVETRVHDAPPIFNAETGEEAVEITVRTGSGDLLLETFEGITDPNPLGLRAYGLCRLRVACAGRDRNPDESLEVSAENYRLDIWPTPDAEEDTILLPVVHIPISMASYGPSR